MDFVYMDQIIKINEDDMDVVVQPSVQWVDLNQKLKQIGSDLFFPMDPGVSICNFFAMVLRCVDPSQKLRVRRLEE